jgi:homospermidine synthase
MQSVPLQPVPSQSTKVVLGGQNCQILVYQKPQGVFVDINADGVDISVGTIARDAVPLISREYTGFIGNLIFIDTQGSDDPSYSGLGDRFAMVYLTAEEYALI